MAVGLAVLGYLTWQLVVTDIVSERRQAEHVEQLLDAWEPTPGVQLDPAEPADLGGASALVRVPRFGDDYVMPVLEGVSDDQLSAGFGHVEDSAGPGGVGNYVLAAHRITHGQPLRDMPSLQPGDTVLVETRDTRYTYELDTDPNLLVVDASAGWVLAADPVNPDPDGVHPDSAPELITLLTCAELFHTDDRMVVFGHLVAHEPR